MKLGHTEKPRVVIDTNIVISAPLSKESSPAKIFELLLVEEIENYTSEEIIKEIKGVFKREKIKSKLSQDKINFIIENFRKSSKIVKPHAKLYVIKEDPSDNKILECAETAKADFIISGDMHLRELINYKNIRISSPKEFLEMYLQHKRISR